MTIKVSVIGATGRMGKLALDVIKGAQDLELHSALDSKSELSQALGADVIFEATKLEVSREVVAFAIENKVNVLVATSGWSEGDRAAIKADSAVVFVPNFSVGSVLGSKFAALLLSILIRLKSLKPTMLERLIHRPELRSGLLNLYPRAGQKLI
jgi:4-hydroxy-tetrahydrodipicolinate reductase